MAEDYYSLLGVPRTATSAEILKAYRGLARKHHPDLNPDDKQAKQKFQQIQKAFETLNDAEKRKLYDQFGADYEQLGAGGRPGGGAPYGGEWSGTMPEGFEGIDLGDLLRGFGMGGGPTPDPVRGTKTRARRGRAAQPGDDVQREILVPFTTAVLGGSLDVPVQRPDGTLETLAVKIPAGIAAGGKIRLRGKGGPGVNGGPAGDLLLIAKLGGHPYFSRDELDLEVKLPITLAEALHGAKVDVPTPAGVIALKIPPGTNSGRRLRAKGRGIAKGDGTTGDLYAVVQIQLPEEISPQLRAAIDQLPEENPRQDLKW
ncbi:MAG: DnaJ C-terminal domain-containing protein [Pirellulales bacterium]|nr:DnaJ C-terminal domain-containing protein [Pirellulales bacterium]